MYADIKKWVKVGNKAIPYADVYVDSIDEAKTISHEDYITGTKLYVVSSGEMYISCSSGWFDTDGTALS